MSENELQTVSSQLLPVNKQAVQELELQRELLKDFVRSQLIEAKFQEEHKKDPSYGEGDYGIIPGTHKRCLFKQGAEKLLRLFGLGVRFHQTDKEIDKHANFALYTYKAEVFIIRTNQVLAECEATANSQEIKYKEKTEWRKNDNGVRVSRKIETPIYDVINTLQKMAQKRALVGATLLATGASEYFTQDMLDADDLVPPSTNSSNEPRDVGPSASDASLVAPLCCGKSMMLSKYPDKELGHKPWYCIECKKKIPVVQGEAS